MQPFTCANNIVTPLGLWGIKPTTVRPAATSTPGVGVMATVVTVAGVTALIYYLHRHPDKARAIPFLNSVAQPFMRCLGKLREVAKPIKPL